MESEDRLNDNETDGFTGPIVRINPNEISISDPSYYDEVYVTANKRNTEHYGEFLRGIDFDGEPIRWSSIWWGWKFLIENRDSFLNGGPWSAPTEKKTFRAILFTVRRFQARADCAWRCRKTCRSLQGFERKWLCNSRQRCLFIVCRRRYE